MYAERPLYALHIVCIQMANTIKMVLNKQAQAEFYVDEWPPHQFSTIVARITSATVSYNI